MSASVYDCTGSALSRIVSRAAGYGFSTQALEKRAEVSGFAKKLSQLGELKDLLYGQVRTLEQASRRESDEHGTETPECVKTKVLETLVQMNMNLEEYLDHVALVLEKKEMITAYLQAPFSAEHLSVEAGHHGNFLELFKDMSHFLLSFHNTLTSMEWTSHFDIAESQLDRKLWSVCSLLAKCQRYHDVLRQREDLYRELS